jgi:uncharacterized membrane protein
MLVWIAAYFATALAFLGLDAVWLGTMGSRLYRPKLGPLLRDGFAPAPAAVFYLIYIAGILFFAVAPSLAGGRWSMALLRGAVLGFVAYATYDLTNQATLRDWPVAVTLADLGWGSFVTGMGALAGFFAARWAQG